MPEDKINISEKLMNQIKSGKIKMKPRWYFVLGSTSVILGLVGLTVVSVFLIGLISFSLRAHGPMGAIRFEEMINNFPWWAVALSFIGVCAGVWMLKKYDFSYRKNFSLIVLGFVLSIIIAGWVIDLLGINGALQRRGHMRRFYQQYNQESIKLPAWGMPQRGC